MKASDRVDFGHAEGQAWLRISGLMNEDVAEYKCEAVNPVGKAQSVANLVLKREFFGNLVIYIFNPKYTKKKGASISLPCEYHEIKLIEAFSINKFVSSWKNA